MKTLEITKVVRGTYCSQVTFCEVSETGSRDAFEVVDIEHDSLVPSQQDAADIDAFMGMLTRFRNSDGALEDESEFPPHDADRTAMTDDYADDHSLSNGQRAQEARNKIVHGAEGWVREDYSDMICNMLHLAHSQGIDPNEVIESAMANFRAEAGAL